MATITTTPIDQLVLGDYLLEYSGNEHDGEAATYDEAEYNDLERRALIYVQASLPQGWTADTETDCYGCYILARSFATGRTAVTIAEVVP